MLKSNIMPLCVASAEALLAEISQRYGREQQPRAPEVNAALGELRAILVHCTQLDREYPLPDFLNVTQHDLEIIDDLVRQSKISTEPDSPLWVLAERVRDIVLRCQRPTGQNAAEPTTSAAKPKYTLEYFEWLDSKQPGTGWHFTCDIKDTKPIRCQTVGYVVRETDELVMVAQTLGDLAGPEEQYIGGVQIVKRGILERLPLVQLIG